MLLIADVVNIAISVHNNEHWDLGAASTREQRNQFWARVVGIAHHGHPYYNKLNADPQWCIKRKDSAAPQSDDVVSIGTPSRYPNAGPVYMARDSWDCIPGAGGGVYSPTPAPGTGNYWFEQHYIGQLPAGQIIYAPPVPVSEGAPPVPTPTPPVIAFPPRDEALQFYELLNHFYRQKGRPNMSKVEYPPLHVDMEGTSVWYAEYLRRRVLGAEHVEAANAVLADVEAAWPK